jgi:hypothetical protein
VKDKAAGRGIAVSQGAPAAAVGPRSALVPRVDGVRMVLRPSSNASALTRSDLYFDAAGGPGTNDAVAVEAVPS